MITILTGPIQTGKTTALQRIADGSDLGSVRGVLQPVVDGRRYVQDVSGGAQRVLEVPEGTPEQDIVRVGRFAFAAATFAWARACLHRALRDGQPGEWIFVDEVGPLELRGEGLAPALQAVIDLGRAPEGLHVLLVVREPLLEQAARVLRLPNARIVRVGERLTETVWVGDGPYLPR